MWGSINPDARPMLSGATTSVGTTTDEKPLTYECNQDGKICPDGSIVGRAGPSCEFAACAPAESKSGTIKTTMGQKMTAIHVTITPHEIVDDSRCPADVQCIWAGTAHLRATVTTSSATEKVVFELGHALTLDNYTITLTEITPAPHAGETIPSSSYRFVFTVAKK